MTPSPALARQGVVVVEATIEKVHKSDPRYITQWWSIDNALTYSTQHWNDCWCHCCANIGAGREMVKLVVSRNHYSKRKDVSRTSPLLEKGDILGMAYFRRHIIVPIPNIYAGDRKEKVSETCILGIRVAPKYNPEAHQRLDFEGRSAPYIHDHCIRGIASALLCHILCTSVQDGNRRVSVFAIKNERAECFYQNFFGVPIGLGEDGRRMYGATANQIWTILQRAFSRHLKMWMMLEERLQQEPIPIDVQATSSTPEQDGIMMPHGVHSAMKRKRMHDRPSTLPDVAKHARGETAFSTLLDSHFQVCNITHHLLQLSRQYLFA